MSPALTIALLLESIGTSACWAVSAMTLSKRHVVGGLAVVSRSAGASCQLCLRGLSKRTLLVLGEGRSGADRGRERLLARRRLAARRREVAVLCAAVGYVLRCLWDVRFRCLARFRPLSYST